MTILTKKGDIVKGKKLVCQYRKEHKARLVNLTGGHKGMQRVVEGLPAEAIVDLEWGPIANRV
ncbi:MAG: hypothetical protein HYS81_00690 [Candidatus Aenigmatarchaeota archaeon]|nr:MAG: hypothetical protein HYS81_00690 [Candidatus Aenigmarchaeota archaeon]